MLTTTNLRIAVPISGYTGEQGQSTGPDLSWCTMDGCRVQVHPECCYNPNCLTWNGREEACAWLDYLKGMKNDRRNSGGTLRQDIPKISLRYPKDIPKIFARYPQDIPKIFPIYGPMDQWTPRYPHDIPKISSRYSSFPQDIQKISPRYIQDMPKKSPR